jgi:hypothetical protein
MASVTDRATAPLTESEIRDLAQRWYDALSDKLPLETMHTMLAEKDVVMKFPEGTFRGLGEFEAWYTNVRRQFFDQVHTITRFEAHLDGTKANVDVDVRWQASTWESPAPKSGKILADAEQTWTVIRSATTGNAVIQTYSVDKFTPVDAASDR